MKAMVNILIVSLADDTPGHRCLLTLDDDDPQAGGNWWSDHAMGSSNPGRWIFVAAVGGGHVIADSGKEWSLRGLSNPMSEGTTGLGRHKAAYRFIGVGEVAWKVLSVGNLARKWESEAFDPAEVKSNSEWVAAQEAQRQSPRWSRDTARFIRAQMGPLFDPGFDERVG